MEQKLPHYSIGFHFQGELPFPTLKGVGFHYIDSHSYSWNNKNRKNSHCLFQYTVSGKGLLQENGTLYPQQAGDAFLIDIPSESHYYLPDSSDFWEVLYFEFSKECLPMLYKITGHCGPVLHLQGHSHFPEQMFQIYQQALTNGLKTFFENTKTAYSFLVDLMAFSAVHSSEKASKAHIAKNYIHANYYSPVLSLDEIAEHTGVSKFYIIREFQKKFNISPGQYLTELRIRQACRLLQQNVSYTLDEVAQMTGFSNSNYFGKVFKRLKHMTPVQYRKQNEQYDYIRIMYETPRTAPKDII